nr:NAC domain-containing protein 68-like [Aegilops tauschii subsp. strangulata]
MEAYKFGFGLGMPPAFKFDPTDGDIVAYYLLPRALGLPTPHAHAIIEEDPGSAPPWELLRRHGGDGGIEHAFFFGPPTDGGRRRRTVKGGGVRQGQKLNEGTVTMLGPGGAELDIAYKRYDLTFKLKAGRGSVSTGYVMHEYEITSPPLPGKVLTRVNISSNAKKEKAPGAATAGADQQVMVPDPELPGTSYYDHDAAAMASIGEGLGDSQAGALYGGNGGDTADADSCYTPLNCVLPDGAYIDYGLSYTNQLAAATTSHSQGFIGAQADSFYGCGMAGTNGAYYDPSPFVPVASQEVAPWPNNQLGQIHSHNQYYAGDSSLMCSGGEQQAGGALCGYNDDGGAMKTVSAHSTVLPCNGGEENRDEIYDYEASRRQRRRLQ